MFSYGKVYSKLPVDVYELINKAVTGNSIYGHLAKIYLYFFGYPDVAGQMRYLMVENLLKLKGGEKVLDAGCGNGIYLHEFASRFG